jgi:hypothetical protein
MHQSAIMHVNQSRKHTTQHMPHPANSESPTLQELLDVCVEVIKNKTNHRWLRHTLKDRNVKQIYNVRMPLQRGVAPHHGIGMRRS